MDKKRIRIITLVGVDIQYEYWLDERLHIASLLPTIVLLRRESKGKKIEKTEDSVTKKMLRRV